ncbi:DUF6508 domain-containing protein [Deinococcus actinosclerus]|uniref:Uncharacterized protein n=1 Tax=Deinococcus actinosclerus TaxID=1768108 RepID=A0ABM5X9Z4_9DEIO|nr:DUF6508 domain-containing protein [Deinococcus actinosclerus]ALW90519.1 hypothetical protein AUC44_15605 [Deinococcus actinosclerus]
MRPQFTPEALRAVAAFLPVMADPAFRFTDGQPPAVVLPDGGVQMRGYAYDPQVARLLRTLDEFGWVHADERFQWPRWAQSPEARALRDDPAVLARATPVQLARLLTVFARQERFSDGARLGFWESGLLLGILRRAAALADTAGRAGAAG